MIRAVSHPRTVCRRKLLALVASLLAVSYFKAQCSADEKNEVFSPRMSFENAARPYLNVEYRRDGFVDRQGRVQGGGLGCSAYVSVVLHRIQFGAEWLSNYNLKVHQGYGDAIAGYFRLSHAATVPASSLIDSDGVQSLLAELTIRPGMLYLFNVRRGEQGHVGFVRVKSNGTLIQSHFSGLKSIGGLATGNFASWLTASQYVASDVELYEVPEILN
jgi:hypothetical protein